MYRWLHFRFIYRQLAAPNSQVWYFMGCIAIAIMSMMALEGWSAAVRQTLFNDARQLHGGDIIIRSYYPFSPVLENTLSRLQQTDRIHQTRYFELYTIVRPSSGNQSLLSRLKAVETGYPLYGAVNLETGMPLAQQLKNGSVIVARALLDRLQLAVGDHVTIGTRPFRIADVVISEPDQPGLIFSLGPRVLMTSQDLLALDLMQPGSRVRHVGLIQVTDPKQLNPLTETFKDAARSGQEQVTTYRSARSRVKQFWDRFFLFLKLVNLFTVIVAGLGMHSALTAFFMNANKDIAILKAVGSPSPFIWANYLVLVFVWGGLGVIAGLGGASLLQYLYPFLGKNLIPIETPVPISWPLIGQGLLWGLILILLFSLPTFLKLKRIRPLAIIRQSPPHRWDVRSLMLTAGGLMLFIGLTTRWWTDTPRSGVYYLIGMASFLGIIGLLTQLAYTLLKRIAPASLVWRLALKGLFRPLNATRTMITTLTAALTLIFTVYLLENAMVRTYQQALSPTAANVYFIDIQPDQLSAVRQILGVQQSFYPVIRARLTAINGKKINRQEELRRVGDNLAREFNLTYRHYLLDDEYLLQGQTLFTPGDNRPQVSVLQKVARIGDLKPGDQLGFNIQGIPLNATVSSIRARHKASFEPYFYFVFPDEILNKAPHTFFTAAKLPPDELVRIQAQITARFPNISVINFTDTLARFTSVLGKLGVVVRGVASFSLIAGFLIIINAFMATRWTRIKEVVYYKIVGAPEGFILKIYMLESTLIAGISALFALLAAHLATALISRVVFDLAYQVINVKVAALALAFVLGIALMGLLASRTVSNYKPMQYLKSQGE